MECDDGWNYWICDSLAGYMKQGAGGTLLSMVSIDALLSLINTIVEQPGMHCMWPNEHRK